MESPETFPCTLADIGGNARLVHVTAETGGSRYYLASAQTIPEAERIAGEYISQYTGRGMPISFFLVDRNGSHSINGGPAEFAALFA